MKCIAPIAVFTGCALAACATVNEGIAPETDFKTITPEQVMTLLQNAENIHVRMSEHMPYSGISYDIGACNGTEKNYRIRENYCYSVVQTHVDDPAVLRFGVCNLLIEAFRHADNRALLITDRHRPNMHRHPVTFPETNIGTTSI